MVVGIARGWYRTGSRRPGAAPSPLLQQRGWGRQRPEEVITINRYELMLITHPATEAERQAEILDRFKATVEAGKGAVAGVDDWGKRKLAYEIKHQTEGVYTVVTFTATPETLAEAERVLGITDEVLRFMTTRPKA